MQDGDPANLDSLVYLAWYRAENVEAQLTTSGKQSGSLPTTNAAKTTGSRQLHD